MSLKLVRKRRLWASVLANLQDFDKLYRSLQPASCRSCNERESRSLQFTPWCVCRHRADSLGAHIMLSEVRLKGRPMNRLVNTGWISHPAKRYRWTHGTHQLRIQCIHQGTAVFLKATCVQHGKHKIKKKNDLSTCRERSFNKPILSYEKKIKN